MNKIIQRLVNAMEVSSEQEQETRNDMRDELIIGSILLVVMVFFILMPWGIR